MVSKHNLGDWDKYLQTIFVSDLYQKITDFLNNNAKHHIIYPAKNQLFNAFKYCSFNNTKIAVIAQDPYHSKNQANGLCFAVNNNVAIPPSLKNINIALKNDIGKNLTANNLVYLAKQGVLLLNSTLTVEHGKANSHANIGWQEFSDKVIKILSENKNNLVFMLWGKHAQKKIKFINNKKHLILLSSHPSPFSAYKGFLNCRHFSIANKYLKKNQITTINW